MEITLYEAFMMWDLTTGIILIFYFLHKFFYAKNKFCPDCYEIVSRTGRKKHQCSWRPMQLSPE